MRERKRQGKKGRESDCKWDYIKCMSFSIPK